MPSGSSTAWLKGIVLGITRSTSKKNVYFVQKLQGGDFSGQKNPKPILPYLHELDEREIHYYFQVTLNDYVKEGFEPKCFRLSKTELRHSRNFLI